MSHIQVHRPLTIEQTEVARYLALEQTAAGFTLPSAESSDRHFFFSLPGAVALPAVIYYRTRHTGTPAFSVRVNDATVTQYNFVDGDEAERTWHEIVPAHTAGGPTLRPEGNGFDHAVTGMVALKTSWFRRADATGHRAEEQAVVMHELGHVLGLAHVDDPGELMYPSVTRTSYGSGDIEGLAKLGAVRCG